MQIHRKSIRMIGLIAIAVALLAAVWYWYRVRARISHRAESHQMLYSSISDVREMVRITTLEGVRSTHVEYNDGRIGAYAIGTYRFRVSYDVESMHTTLRGDTLVVRLPHEQITILEDEHQGFKVIDVWARNILTSMVAARLSIQQENEMRAQAMEQVRKSIEKGELTTEMRSRAIQLITDMLSLVPGTVIVLGYDEPVSQDLLPKLPTKPALIEVPHQR